MDGSGYPVQVGTVNCAVLVDDGISESLQDRVPEAVVKFRCPWSQRYALVDFIVGKVIPAGVQTIRLPPMRYPGTDLFGVDVSEIKPSNSDDIIVGPSGWPSYLNADVTARFSLLPYGVDTGNPFGEAYVTIDTDTNGEFIKYPNTSWKFIGGGDVQEEVALPYCSMGITYTIYQLGYLPLAEIGYLTNKVNLYPVTIGPVTYSEGTLLFTGAQTKTEYGTLGGVKIQASYKIAYRDQPWNYLFNPLTSSWEEVSSDGTTGGLRPFIAADYSILPK